MTDGRTTKLTNASNKQEAEEVLSFVQDLTNEERQNFLLLLQGAKLARVLMEQSRDMKEELTTV